MIFVNNVVKHVINCVMMFHSPSVIINIVDVRKRTHGHKVEIFLHSLNINDYNIELPRIYSPAKV